MAADRRDARALALEILGRVERDEAFASILLDHAETGLEDPREIGLLHRIVLGVLRERRLLDHVAGQVSSRPLERMDPLVRNALRIGLYGIHRLERVPDFAAVSSAVELVKRGGKRSAAGFVNGVLRSALRGGATLLPPQPSAGDVESLALYRSHPSWWTRRVVARLGWERATRLLEANNRPARTVVRTNLDRIEPDALREEMTRSGLEVEPARFLPQAIRVGSGSLRASGCLRRGLAWVQDEAAQLVVALFGRRPAGRIADLCAAPGGKTLQLAECLDPSGIAVAVDLSPRRLERVVENLRRYRVERAFPLAADVSAGPQPLNTTFDRVLLDAPCSGTGTLRRHPEIRWRLSPDDLKLLQRRQRQLLSVAARLTAPGGRLVYSVCSLEPEEGEEVVREFIADDGRFAVEDPRPELPAACAELIGDDRFLRTSPDVDGLDGFFAARLVRR